MFIMSGLFLQSSHRSDCDQSVQGLTVFYFASFCFDADQVSEVLEVEEQQVIPKVQERQTLQGEKDGKSEKGCFSLEQGQIVLEKNKYLSLFQFPLTFDVLNAPSLTFFISSCT